jgi:hypothetical protein
MKRCIGRSDLLRSATAENSQNFLPPAGRAPEFVTNSGPFFVPKNATAPGRRQVQYLTARPARAKAAPHAPH